MSHEQFGETSRRAFLGTATAATAAATLTAPVAGEAHGADAGHPIGKLAQADADVPAQLASRAKAGDWTKPAAMAIPKEGYFKLEQGRYGPIFPKLRPTMASRLLLKSNRVAKKRSERTEKQ